MCSNTSPNVSDCEDKKGKNAIDGELVPVVGPLHVDLVLPQPGHSVAGPSLGCEALQLSDVNSGLALLIPTGAGVTSNSISFVRLTEILKQVVNRMS